jgi:hypothetical protein
MKSRDIRSIVIDDIYPWIRRDGESIKEILWGEIVLFSRELVLDDFLDFIIFTIFDSVIFFFFFFSFLDQKLDFDDRPDNWSKS